MNRLIRLFPRPWRDRYADEFDALLEQVPSSPHVVTDVVLAAGRARLGTALQGPRAAQRWMETPEAQRGGAIAAIAAGGLWVLTFAIGGVVGWGRYGRDWGFILLIIAAGGILVAHAILAAGWRASGSRLAWLGVGASSIGMAILVVALMAAIVLEYPLSVRLGWTPPEFWEAGMVLTAGGMCLVGLAAIAAGGVRRIAGALILVTAIPLALWLLVALPHHEAGEVLRWRAVGPGVFEPVVARRALHALNMHGWFAPHLAVWLTGVIVGLAWVGLGVDRLRRLRTDGVRDPTIVSERQPEASLGPGRSRSA